MLPPCDVGYPDPEVVWFKDDQSIRESRHFQTDYDEDGNCSLIISDVCGDDDAKYTCKAVNSLGEAACTAEQHSVCVCNFGAVCYWQPSGIFACLDIEAFVLRKPSFLFHSKSVIREQMVESPHVLSIQTIL